MKRGDKSGWAYTVRISGSIVAEKSSALKVTTSSMAMEMKAIIETLILVLEIKISPEKSLLQTP